MNRVILTLTLLALLAVGCGQGNTKKQAATNETAAETPVEEHVFPNATLAQAYDVIKGIYPGLKAALPAKDLEYVPENAKGIITYRYESPQHVHIVLNYASGVTRIEIREDGANTLARITRSR